MQNADRLFKILYANGIRIDSTVAPGARLVAGSYGAFDFTRFDMSAFWQYGPLTEIPILTGNSCKSVFFYANPLGMRTRRIVSRSYQTRLAIRNKSRLQKIHSLFARDYHMADFNFLSPNRLAKMIRAHAGAHAELDELPVVLIGHSKSTYYADRIHELLHELQKMQLCYEIVGISKCYPATIHK